MHHTQVGSVSVLMHDEHIQMDSNTLKALQTELGESAAQTAVCRALEDLANRLSLVERCYYQDDPEALWKAAKGMIGTADHVGLSGLAQVANDLATVAQAKDAVALAAVFGRLIRLGDRSLTAIWDTSELSV